MFSVSDGTLIWSARDGGGPLAFSPAGPLVATLGKNGLNVWQASNGNIIRSIPGALGSAAFSPDGLLLATASAKGGEFPQGYTVELFRVEDGQLVRTLSGAGVITSMVFTPDGQYLLSGSSDPNQDPANGFVASTGSVRIWRISDGSLLRTYDQDTGTAVTSVSVSPDGSLFSYTHDSEVVVARFPSLPCTISIMPAVSDTVRCDGGSGTVSVLAPIGCNWTATSRVDWISITSGSSGIGPGVVHYTVRGNGCQALRGSNLTVVGLLIIGGQTFPVTQSLSAP